MPKVVVTDSKGLVQETGKGVVGLVQSKTVKSQLIGGDLVSGAIEVPANSLITNVYAAVTKNLVGAAANVLIRVGTEANGEQLCEDAILRLTAVQATAGTGISTNGEVRIALAGAQSLTFKPGTIYRDEDTEVHITTGHDGQNLTDGEVQYTVEFITFS